MKWGLKIEIYKNKTTKNTVICMLIPSKDNSYYSFVNISKGHICKCKFKTYEDGIEDLNNQVRLGKVLSYEFLSGALIDNNIILSNI